MLDGEARRELRSLSKETADLVARHLVMTGRLLDEDPERSLAHARAARALAGRIGVVREAAGLAAYAGQEWTEALSELRAARRITGRPEHLSVMADCERALGRPERALTIGADPEVPSLPQNDRVELAIVVAGARRDLGQADAAVVLLQEPARRTLGTRPWAARLWYAYADALLGAGDLEQARHWFAEVVDVDPAGETDAVERLLELDGVVLDDEGPDAEGNTPADDLAGAHLGGDEDDDRTESEAASLAAADALMAEIAAESRAARDQAAAASGRRLPEEGDVDDVPDQQHAGVTTPGAREGVRPTEVAAPMFSSVEVPVTAPAAGPVPREATLFDLPD